MTRFSYVFAITFVAFIAFVLYVYYTDKKTLVADDSFWLEKFNMSSPYSKPEYDELSHDDDEWFYLGRPTCVAYGDWVQPCVRNQFHCAGGKTVGNANQQVDAVVKAIRNGGVHPLCPLL